MPINYRRLRELKSDLGLKQYDIAELAGVGRDHIARVLTGENGLSRDATDRLLAGLEQIGVSAGQRAWLMLGHDECRPA